MSNFSNLSEQFAQAMATFEEQEDGRSMQPEMLMLAQAKLFAAVSMASALLRDLFVAQGGPVETFYELLVEQIQHIEIVTEEE